MNIKTKIQNKLQVWASAYLNHHLNPKYKELGQLVSDALEAARLVLPGIIHHVKDHMSLGYVVGYYRSNQGLIQLAYGSHELDHSDPKRVLAREVSMLLYFADAWKNNLINPRELETNERIMRDTASRIHYMVNNMKGEATS